MAPKRFFDVIRDRKFDLTDRDFSNAEPNPFFKKSGKMSTLAKMTDEGSMRTFVRNRGPRQGLDRVSRAHVGSDSGVNGSRYKDMVRDTGDVPADDDRIPPPEAGTDKYFPDFYGKDNAHISTNDRSYQRNEFNDEEDLDDYEADAGMEFMRNLNAEYATDEQRIHGGGNQEEPEEEDENILRDEENVEDSEGYEDTEDDGELQEPEDSKYEGIVRTIKGAYLVSKKKQPDETYTEVWMYNIGKKFETEANIRKSILSGTDIDPIRNASEDDSQEASITSVGNVQFMTLTGIPD
jgi:hypothetical protein